MAHPLTDLDWTLINSFLGVAETGSMSAAARELGQSQPTIGRHIAALEDALEVELFQRHSRGLSLTPMGAQILPAAEEMRAALNRIALTAETGAGRLEGTVRIACSVFAAHYLLPPIIARMREEEPAISLVLHPSDNSDNLTFREADIAVRMYRPTQLDLVTRHVGEIAMGIFASHSYLARRGRPETANELVTHDLVGFDRTPLIVDAMRARGFAIEPDDFPVRCDSQSAYWELVRSGCGIGFSQRLVGRADPNVAELTLEGVTLPSLPVWLTAHGNVRRLPRVARIWELLGEELGRVVRKG